MNRQPKRIVYFKENDGSEPFGAFLWSLGKQGKHGTAMAIIQFLKDIEKHGIELTGCIQTVSPDILYFKPYPFPNLFIFMGVIENGVWVLLNQCLSDKATPPKIEINLAKKRYKRCNLKKSS